MMPERLTPKRHCQAEHLVYARVHESDRRGCDQRNQLKWYAAYRTATFKMSPWVPGAIIYDISIRSYENLVRFQRPSLSKDDVTTSQQNNRVLCNQDHILFPLLPDERDFTYNPRNRNHNRLLSIKQGRCAVVILSPECCSKPVIDFVVLHFILAIFSLIYMYYCVIVAFCQHVLNEHAMLCYAMHINCLTQQHGTPT